MATVNFAHVTRYLKNEIESSDRECQRFAERFAQNPHDAFQWAEESLRAAARGYVAKLLTIALKENSEILPEVLEFAKREVLQGARHPKSSTSGISNLSSLAETSAYAEFVSRFGAL